MSSVSRRLSPKVDKKIGSEKRAREVVNLWKFSVPLDERLRAGAEMRTKMRDTDAHACDTARTIVYRVHAHSVKKNG